MSELTNLSTAIRSSIESAPDMTVPTLRRIRREVSEHIRELPPSDVIELAELILKSDGVPRWFVYELVHFHRGALGSLDGLTLSRLGHGISSWGDVDSFACYLSGVVWRKGGIDDAEVHAWAASRDRWWRRTALVSTIPLNNPARGGHGDPRRTLEMCDLLKADRDDMVVKALSWALRELAKKEPELVAEYLNEAESELASRVVCEVRNKLETGLKNP